MAILHSFAVTVMRTIDLLHIVAMLAAAEDEWREFAPTDWTTIDFRQWPRGFHRSAWTVASYVGWNPLDVLDDPPPAARGVNAIVTRACVSFIAVMTKHVAPPNDPEEPLLAWFNVAAEAFEDDIAGMVEAMGDVDWCLPESRRWAARRVVKMWEKGGAVGFRDLTATLRFDLKPA